MGLASRMAPTCNVWHLLGGLPLLAASSILFCIGMLGGAFLGGILLTQLLGTKSTVSQTVLSGTLSRVRQTEVINGIAGRRTAGPKKGTNYGNNRI